MGALLPKLGGQQNRGPGTAADHVGGEHHLEVLLLPAAGGEPLQFLEMVRLGDKLACRQSTPTADARNDNDGLLSLGISYPGHDSVVPVELRHRRGEVDRPRRIRGILLVRNAGSIRLSLEGEAQAARQSQGPLVVHTTDQNKWSRLQVPE